MQLRLLSIIKACGASLWCCKSRGSVKASGSLCSSQRQPWEPVPTLLYYTAEMYSRLLLYCSLVGPDGCLNKYLLCVLYVYCTWAYSTTVHICTTVFCRQSASLNSEKFINFVILDWTPGFSKETFFGKTEHSSLEFIL